MAGEETSFAMSRFTNLEFNHESEGDLQSGAVVKDESFYLSRATGAFEQGEFDRSLRDFSKVLEFNPLNAPAWTGQVRALIELGELREAKLWADKALERLPKEPELLAAKAVALARTGDLEAALAFSDASIEERGDTSYVWLARADVLLARKETRADYCFEKAFLLNPRNWVVGWLASRIRYFYRQFAAALRLAERALEWDPSQCMVWLQLGLCQQQLGLLVPARHSLSQAIELNRDCAAAHKARRDLDAVGPWQRFVGRWRSLFAR
jgi:tetratricopeptide (TPR) repeat protein